MDPKTLDEELVFKERLRKFCQQRVVLKSDYENIVNRWIKDNKSNANHTLRYTKKDYFDEDSSEIYKSGNMTLLTEMHPGQRDFSDLVRGMSPIVVEGLEHLKGVYGETSDQMHDRLGTTVFKIGQKKKSYDRSFYDNIVSGKNRIIYDIDRRIDDDDDGVCDNNDKISDGNAIKTNDSTINCNLNVNANRIIDEYGKIKDGSVENRLSPEIDEIKADSDGKMSDRNGIDDKGAECRVSNETAKTSDDGKDEKPLHGSNVWIHYALYLEGATVPLDSSQNAASLKNLKTRGNSVKIKADCSALIPGLVVAVRWLPIGSRGRFILPSSCMFGTTGCSQLGVKPGASILLLLHSVRHLDANAINRYENLDNASKRDDFVSIFKLVASVNAMGKDCFFRKNLVGAVKMYAQSLKMLAACHKNNKNYEEHSELYNKTLVNLAFCHQLTDRPRTAIEYLDYVDIDNCDAELDCKALFIRSKCLYMMGELTESIRLARRCLTMRPSNIDISKHHSIVYDALHVPNYAPKKQTAPAETDAVFERSCESTKKAFIDVIKSSDKDRFIIKLTGGVNVEDFYLIQAVMDEFKDWGFKVMDNEIVFRKCCNMTD